MKKEKLKVHPSFPKAKVLFKIIRQADDYLMEATSPRFNWKERVVSARGRLEDAMQLLEAIPYDWEKEQIKKLPKPKHP